MMRLNENTDVDGGKMTSPYRLQQHQISAKINSTTNSISPLSSLSNPVVDNFEFTVKNALKCDGCGVVSHNEEKLMCLQASIALASSSSLSSSVTLQRVIDAYFRSEKVEKRCEECGAETAVKTVTVKR